MQISPQKPIQDSFFAIFTSSSSESFQFLNQLFLRMQQGEQETKLLMRTWQEMLQTDKSALKDYDSSLARLGNVVDYSDRRSGGGPSTCLVSVGAVSFLMCICACNVCIYRSMHACMNLWCLCSYLCLYACLVYGMDVSSILFESVFLKLARHSLTRLRRLGSEQQPR